jgi:hypothetical protein
MARVATLVDAVNFYNTRFHLNRSRQDKDELLAFFETLSAKHTFHAGRPRALQPDFVSMEEERRRN